MLIDSNIVIYSVQPDHFALRLFLNTLPRTVSVVSYIEALGYQRLSDDARIQLTEFFEGARILPLTDAVAEQAINLRQQRRMGLGDSIIAATAITHNLTLVTHNTEDFRWIAGLELLDPLTNNP
ncbi:MAG: type II toxin-antitoxin system VapC family toxin [Chloroflexi bacterium]|nr:type II toxin-antitoxin system VapC family toxin [Chloroflexota bacterium]